jgi:N-acetylmuramoyl-L-alanine amidase
MSQNSIIFYNFADKSAKRPTGTLSLLGVKLLKLLPKRLQLAKIIIFCTNFIKFMRNLIIQILLLVIPLVGVNAVSAQNVASEQIKRSVVIDPGHGGPRPGKQHRDIVEKDYVLDVSIEVRKQLSRKMPELDVYLTRSCDSAYHESQSTDNRLRAEFCNNKAADLYVGIHANALGDTKVKGCEVWVLTLNEKLMNQNKLVGARYADDGDFINPEDIDRNSQGFMMALSRQLENEPYSRFFAEECCKNMASYGLVNKGVKAGTVYTVLYYSECPGVIVEMGYLTNNDDYNYLYSKGSKQEMATAISDAIVTYFKTLYGSEPCEVSEAAEETASTQESVVEESKAEEINEGYAIQLISSMKEVDINDYQFKEYKGKVRLIMGSGKYKFKYCYGSYKSSADAQEDLNHARKTFKDAYIVKYNNGAIVAK